MVVKGTKTPENCPVPPETPFWFHFCLSHKLPMTSAYLFTSYRVFREEAAAHFLWQPAVLTQESPSRRRYHDSSRICDYSPPP